MTSFGSLWGSMQTCFPWVCIGTIERTRVAFNGRSA